MILCSDTAMIYPVDDSITRTRSKRTYKQCLCRPVETCALSFEDGVVFGEAENDTNDDGDAYRDEESVVRVFYGEVRDHGKEATFEKIGIKLAMEASQIRERRRNAEQSTYQ